MTHIDFGRHGDDYAEYRPGFPESFYSRLGAIVPMAGSRDLDRFDTRLRTLLEDRDPVMVDHRIWCLVARTPR
jgi:hypothetical protein